MTSVQISSANWLYLNTLTSRWAVSCVRGVVFVPGWVHHEQISLHLFLVSALFVVMFANLQFVCTYLYCSLKAKNRNTPDTFEPSCTPFLQWRPLITPVDSTPDSPREDPIRQKPNWPSTSVPSPQGSVLLRAVGMDLFVVIAALRGIAAKHFGVIFAPGGETDNFLQKCKFCRLCLVLCKENEFWHGYKYCLLIKGLFYYRL